MRALAELSSDQGSIMDQKTATGLAIAGFVILIISLVIPIYGLYIGLIALAFVAIGGFFGDRIFTVLTVSLSAVKVLFLSPTFRILTASYDGANDDRVVFYALFLVAHLVPVVALFVSSKRTLKGGDGDTGVGMPRGN